MADLVIVLLLAMAQLEPSPDAVLARAQARVLDNVARMPRYACTQTTEREMRRPAEPRWRGATCKEIAESRERGYSPNLKIYAKDRLRLDLIYVEGHESHQWTGGGTVAAADMETLFGGGILATGDFNGFTKGIFGGEVSRIQFERETAMGARRAYEYRYEVDENRSTYFMRGTGGPVKVPYRGTFRIEVGTAALVQLTVETENLPATLSLCSSSVTVDFATVPIRGNDTLLPSLTRVHSEGTSAHDSVNVTHYDQCREFTATSQIRFGGEDEPVGPPAQAWVDLAALTRVRLRLETPIDSRTSAAGDQVVARAAGDRELIFRGRILRMVQTFQPKRGFWVALDFNEVLSGTRSRSIRMRGDSGPGTAAGGWFWLSGRDHVELKTGWESLWDIEP